MPRSEGSRAVDHTRDPPAERPPSEGVIAAPHPATSVGVRVRVGFLFVYLALPIDVILDFAPVLEYAECHDRCARPTQHVSEPPDLAGYARPFGGVHDGPGARLRPGLLGVMPSRHRSVAQFDEGDRTNAPAQAGH